MHSMNPAPQTTAALVAAAEAAGDTATAQALRDAWCVKAYGDLSDYEIADWAMSVDSVIIEHDMHCCCDAPDGYEVSDDFCVSRKRRLLASLTHEADRRERTGLRIVKDSDPSYERDCAPYGPEWQREQAEREMSGCGILSAA